MKSSNLIKQILEKKSREVSSHKRSSKVLDKLHEISLIENFNEFILCSEEVSEVLLEEFDYIDIVRESSKYSPVASVACMEVYTKSVYGYLIDYGSPFIERLSDFKIEFNLKTAIELKVNSLTIGDLSSHLIPASNFENITGNLKKLLNIDFIKELKRKHVESLGFYQIDLFNSNFTKEEVKKSMEKDAEKFITNLKEIINIRHLICHENTHYINTDQDIFLKSSMYVRYFVILTEEIIDSVIQKQTEENE